MASYADVTNIIDKATSFMPTFAFPLDARSMFGSLAKAQAAAASAKNAGDKTTKYYFGQDITVFENDVVTKYQIAPNSDGVGELVEIGSKVVADGKSIEVDEIGTVSMKSFGKQYYKYVAADNILDGTYDTVDALPTDAANGSYAKVADAWYIITDGVWAAAGEGVTPRTHSTYELVENSWKEGLEPKVALNSTANGYEIAWYEPSTTTAEGVSSTLVTVQTTVNQLSQTVGSNYDTLMEKIDDEATRAKGVEDGLTARVAKNETDIATLNGNATVEGSVDYKIAEAFAPLLNNEEAMNSMQELVDYLNTHGESAVQLSNDVAANKTAIAAINALLGTQLPGEAQATTVIDYIVEVVNAEKDRAVAAEEALAGRLDTAEGKLNALGTAANKNVEEFATAAQGAKADTAVQSVVAGEQNGHIAVDGTDVQVYTLPNASATEAGGVKVDGTTIVSNDGTISVESVPAAKVAGLDDKIAAAKEAAVSEANAYTDDKAVAKANVVDSTTVAADKASASAEKVVSEELLLDALTWKETM